MVYDTLEREREYCTYYILQFRVSEERFSEKGVRLKEVNALPIFHTGKQIAMKSPSNKTMALNSALHEQRMVTYAKTLKPRSTSDGRTLTPCTCNISMEEGMRIERFLASDEWNRMVEKSQGYDNPDTFNPRKSRAITGKSNAYNKASNSNASRETSLAPNKAETLTQGIKAIDLLE
jgi:hypothetical protein